MSDCYYGEDSCDDDLWQCETCGEWFCSQHFHETSKGYCVECVACERERLEEEKRDPKNMTDSDFDAALWEVITLSGVMEVPGVHELVAEAYNNEAIEYWQEEMV